MNNREHKIIANAITAMSIAISMREYKLAEAGAKEIQASIRRLVKEKNS